MKRYIISKKKNIKLVMGNAIFAILFSQHVLY